MFDYTTPVSIQYGNDSDGWTTIGWAPNSEQADFFRARYVRDACSFCEHYYAQMWVSDDGNLMIDYGSHTIFFRYVPSSEDYMPQGL